MADPVKSPDAISENLGHRNRIRKVPISELFSDIIKMFPQPMFSVKGT